RDPQVRVRRTREVGQQRYAGRGRVGVVDVPVLEVERGEGIDNGHRPGGRAEPEVRLAEIRAGPVAGVVLDDEGQAIADRARALMLDLEGERGREVLNVHGRVGE